MRYKIINSDINFLNFLNSDIRDIIGFFLPSFLSVFLIKLLFLDSLLISLWDVFIGIFIGFILYAINLVGLVVKIFKWDQALISTFKNKGYTNIYKTIRKRTIKDKIISNEISRIRAYFICFINLFVINIILFIMVIPYQTFILVNQDFDYTRIIKILIPMILIIISYFGANNRLKAEKKVWETVLTKDSDNLNGKIMPTDYIIEHEKVKRDMEMVNKIRSKYEAKHLKNQVSESIYKKLEEHIQERLLGLTIQLINIEIELDSYFNTKIKELRTMNELEEVDPLISQIESHLKQSDYQKILTFLRELITR